MQTANGSAIAAGAIVACLIDLLVSKGALSQNEVGNLLGNAATRLNQFGITPETSAARETITAIATMHAKRDR
jgi:hypothetical protein